MTAPVSKHIDLATGINAHVLEWESKSDHTVVLVHGFLDLAWGWRRTAEAGLADNFHVVAPDMRGHGDSARIGAGGYYHFLDYVADLASLVEKLGRSQVSLVGHSMGGSITSYFAGVYPEAVRRLAVLEGLGPPELDVPLPKRVRGWIEAWQRVPTRKPRTYTSLEDAAARLRQHDSLLSEEMSLELAAHGTRRTKEGLQFKHDALHLTRGPYPFRVDYAEELWKAITCPVLLVDAKRSHYQLPAADLQRRMAAFKDAQLASLEESGHMMQRHQPEELARLLVEFLQS